MKKKGRRNTDKREQGYIYRTRHFFMEKDILLDRKEEKYNQGKSKF